MYVRTVRGSTPRASAATRVVTHPDSPALFPHVWSSPTALCWTLRAPRASPQKAVKRRQARYKLGAGGWAGAGTYMRGGLAGWATLAAKFRGFEAR